MMKTRRIGGLAMLVSVIVAVAPASAMFYEQAQTQVTTAAELVLLADSAEQHVKTLIDLVYAKATALQQIEDSGLLDQLEGNVTLYSDGEGNLTAAYTALEIPDYEGAIAYATESLRIFREVFRSIHLILKEAGLQPGELVDTQGLLEAMTRALQRIERLREILPADATEALKLLDDAEASLNLDAAEDLLLEGKVSDVRSNLAHANQLISIVYQYLKELGEDSNMWRIYSYCERVRERMRERFRYGRDEAIDFTGVLQAFGYQSENQFMQTLENMIQIALGKTGDFTNAMQDLEAIGQMVQEMDQALAQEINQHQNRYGASSDNNP